MEEFFTKYKETLTGLVAVGTLVGMIWGGIILYAKWVKPKHAPPTEPTQIVRFTIGEYEARIQAKIDQALQEREHATGKDLDIKNAQLAALRYDLINIEEAFEKQNQFIASLEAQLVREGNTIGGGALEKATQALEAGDTSLAQSLFEEIKARTALDVEASARASFALGEIAEQEVRWKEAGMHYSEAAGKNPNFDTLRKQFEFTVKLGEYLEALPIAKKLFDFTSEKFGEESHEFAATLAHLGLYLYQIGENEPAEKLLKQATKLIASQFGEHNLEYAACLSGLGLVASANGCSQKAIELQTSALSIYNDEKDVEPSKIETLISNLSEAYFSAGDYEKAELMIDKSISICETTYQKTNPILGFRICQLALIQEKTERLEQTEANFKLSISILDQELNANHPQLEAVKANLERFLANRPTAD